MFSFETSPPYLKQNKWEFQRDMIVDAEKKREKTEKNRLCTSTGTELFLSSCPNLPVEYQMLLLQGTKKNNYGTKISNYCLLLPMRTRIDFGGQHRASDVAT